MTDSKKPIGSLPPSAVPRIFVSSVIEGFQAYREEARKAIQHAGGEPVLINEDSPSVNASSRNACLDAIDSSDIFVLLVGSRGGWITPSGRIVIEEELEQARMRKLPILVFLQDVARDEHAQRLARKVSDYVDGFFRIQFHDASTLYSQMLRALPRLIDQYGKPVMHADQLNEYFKLPFSVAQQTTLRFVFGPERQEEIIESPRLISPEFEFRIQELGHRKDVNLFSYQRSKEADFREDTLVVDQHAGNDWRKGIQGVRMSLSESGVVTINTNVTGRQARENAADMSRIMIVPIEEIEGLLQTAFRFADALYEDLDPYKRHQRFFWNTALSEVGFRTLARDTQSGSSNAMNILRGKEPMIAFPKGRLITREDIKQPVREIERAVFSWTKKRSVNF